MKFQYVLVAGSNKGDKKQYLQKARERISAEENITILKETNIEHTPPFLEVNQPEFFNQGFLIKTDLQPIYLLKIVNKIENILGRTRVYPYGPREIDIDIVWWSEGIYVHQSLHIPHPFNKRRFWVRNFIAELDKEAKDEESGVYYHSMAVKPIQHPDDFSEKKLSGEKIVILTCYEYSMANLLGRTSLDAVLVGDSLGNVIQGSKNTLGVTMKNIIYHCQCVRRGLRDAFIIADMPFLAHKISMEKAVQNAGKIIQKGECNAIKVEGAGKYIDSIKSIIDAGIPVMGHLGLEPQLTLKMNASKLRGRSDEEQTRLMQDALALEEAGCFAIVLEMIPAEIAQRLSKKLNIPTIGIGAGPDTDGQVLVLNDILGIDPDFHPRFVRRYASIGENIIGSVESFCSDVRSNKFPNKNESFSIK